MFFTEGLLSHPAPSGPGRGMRPGDGRGLCMGLCPKPSSPWPPSPLVVSCLSRKLGVSPALAQGLGWGWGRWRPVQHLYFFVPEPAKPQSFPALASLSLC